MQQTKRRSSLDNALPHLVTPVIVLAGLVSLFGLVFAFEVDTNLVWDWFKREGDALFLWWLLSTLAGAAVMPIFFEMLPMLPSRGYALARTAGIMLAGFIFWFIASLGLWANTSGSIVMAWLMVVALGVLIWTRAHRIPSTEEPIGVSPRLAQDDEQSENGVSPRFVQSDEQSEGRAGRGYRLYDKDRDLKEWFSQHWTFVLVVEMVFIAMLFGWAMFRAHEPEIRSTEKPMEMMFVNSIRQSEFFPPNDGWLANYSISYYYFGYVIIAALADVSGVNSGIAFGLTGPLLFALAGIGILGLVYDLVRLRQGRSGRHGAIWAGLLGIVMLVIMGNLGTFFIEMPWNGKGILPREADPSYFEFWQVPERSRLAIDLSPDDPLTEKWLLIPENEILEGERPNASYVIVRDMNGDSIPDFKQPDFVVGQDPQTGEDITLKREFFNWDYWWWFRYSRVISDENLAGDPIGVQPIAEFPQFSFVLSDMHPHVLALPFALLAITLAAGVALGKGKIRSWEYVLLAIWVGGMIFMNSWDAVYIPFLVGAYVLRWLIQNGGRLTGLDWGRIAIFAVIVLVLTVIFYAPWIFSFTSQAGGFYMNIIWTTKPQQLFLQFGAFFLLLLPFLAQQVKRGLRSINWMWAVITYAVLFLLIIVVLPFAAALVYQTLCGDGTGGVCTARDILFSGTNPSINDHFYQDIFTRRLPSYLSEGFMLAVMVFVGFRLFGKSKDEAAGVPYEPATGFALLVIAMGVLLIFAPDFIYLVDNFRVRINTVFKLYYQGWIFLSVGTSFSIYAVLSRFSDVWARPTDDELAEVEREVTYPPRASWQLPYIAGLLAVLGMGLFYPYYATRSRALDDTGRYAAQQLEGASESPLTLDGRSSSISPNEYAVVTCFADLNPPPETVIAEAPCNCGYNMTYGRVATLTGVPTLLGWVNHEGQWRGATYESVTETVKDENGFTRDNREIEVDKMFQTTDWVEAQQVINRYGIDYIMVGEAERLRYIQERDADPYALEKFADNLSPVCEAGDVTLYQTGE